MNRGRDQGPRAPRPTDALVLCYHAVSDAWRGDLAVSPRELSRQVAAIVDRGYRGVRFSDAVGGAARGKVLAVTFDDAYRSLIEKAAPILASLDVPGTVFVPTDFATGDRHASWTGMEQESHGASSDELAVMSWGELASLNAEGWEIGSHTCSHPFLTQLDDARLAEELRDSRTEIERRLGIPCVSIAYPYGDTDARVTAAAAAAGYAAGAGLPGGLLQPRSRMNWPRVGIYGGDHRLRFRLKTSSLLRRRGPW